MKVPTDWKEERLGEICDFVPTIALSRAQLEADEGVMCVHYGDIHTKFSDRLDIANAMLPKSKAVTVARVPRLKVGDLVLADASEDLVGVGKSVEVISVGSNEVVGGLHTVVLRPRVGYFAPGFVGLLQHTPRFMEQSRVLASGLKVYGLSKTSISKISVFLPPLEEQKAIAEALSDVDALIDSLEALLSKKRNIKTGVMQELLTGRTRLTGFSNEWGKTSLDELVNSGVVKLGRGNVISKKDMEADPGSCPVYSSAQNNDGCIGAYNKYMFNEELITWSVDGGGYVFYRPKHKFSVTNICGYLRITDESKFQYLFLSAVLQKLHSQHTFDWLNKAHPRVIRNLYREIPIVPITEQKAIANVLSDMGDEIEALEKRLAKTRDLKQGMAQELLTGRTRLI
jgi:type I restriction enzyme S subunit